ncbi:MAG: hypothetical protein GXX01_04770 [Clostridiales bacterium]|jgi:hypothetical protein|nr:hypothetical protein [Clostridiales bacterium]
MKDFNDMNTLLSRAKYEADRFFSKYNNESLRKSVFARIRQKKKSSLKLYAAIACICCFIIGFSALIINEYNRQIEMANASLGDPVSQEKIKLSESDTTPQLLDYFKISKPDQTGDNLLAVIWDSEYNGNYEMVYSSMFENSDEPGPVLMIYFPSEIPDMAVISTHNKNMQFIHYRVLGYRKNQLVTLMEQNYIDEGEIEIINGALKEIRLIPEKQEKIVTYYIPYQVDESGEIIPALQDISINIGEYIAFIGNSVNPVEVSYSSLFTEGENNVASLDKEMKLLYANSTGYDKVLLRPVYGGKEKTVFVRVIGDEQ